jgi:ubiquinone/menaquinone biosynthesis C-methylase UbiE
MGFYEKYCLPKITDFVCSGKPIRYQRKKVVPLAKGRVLEIGIGTGLNLPYYDTSQVGYIWGLDPSVQMLKRAEKRVKDIDCTVEFIGLSDDQIPLASNSVDTVVMTYTLCSIPDVAQALSEMRRVLVPGGDLLFSEHGLAPDETVRRWQKRLNPIWKHFGGGCHLDRPIPGLIEQGGFKIENLDTMYIPGFKPACFNYWGSAVYR